MARRRFSEAVPTNVINIGTGQARGMSSVQLMGNRLLGFRKARGLTQQRLAQIIGVTNNAISMWEKGKARPDMENVVPLCEALQITPSQLFGVLSGVSKEELALISEYRQLYDVNKEIVRGSIRMLKEAQERTQGCRPLLKLEQSPNALSAGGGDYADSVERPDPLWVHDTPLTRRADYVFTVNGDSMEPSYHDKDKVLVTRTEFGMLQPGMVAAFRADGDLYIKEFRRGELHSLNPDYRSYPLSSFGEVYLLGRVIGVLNRDDLATAEEKEAWDAVHGDD